LIAIVERYTLVEAECGACLERRGEQHSLLTRVRSLQHHAAKDGHARCSLLHCTSLATSPPTLIQHKHTSDICDGLLPAHRGASLPRQMMRIGRRWCGVWGFDAGTGLRQPPAPRQSTLTSTTDVSAAASIARSAAGCQRHRYDTSSHRPRAAGAAGRNRHTCSISRAGMPATTSTISSELTGPPNTFDGCRAGGQVSVRATELARTPLQHHGIGPSSLRDRSRNKPCDAPRPHVKDRRPDHDPGDETCTRGTPR
jgi:hypothetical protein